MKYCRERQKRLREVRYRNGLCYCGRPQKEGLTRCSPCAESASRSQKKLDREARLTCLDRYGDSRCAWCGEPDILVLCLDHINNDGAQDRKNRKKQGSFFQALIREGFPKGLQVLCHNCNFRKKLGRTEENWSSPV